MDMQNRNAKRMQCIVRNDIDDLNNVYANAIEYIMIRANEHK